MTSSYKPKPCPLASYANTIRSLLRRFAKSVNHAIIAAAFDVKNDLFVGFFVPTATFKNMDTSG